MHTTYLFLYTLAAVCFTLAIVVNAYAATARIAWPLLAAGLLAWVLVPLIQTGRA